VAPPICACASRHTLAVSIPNPQEWGEVSSVTITITKVEKIEATTTHVFGNQAA
jgi:hypothetical protein